MTSRPPHGGRGLKYRVREQGQYAANVAPRTGGVD